MQLKESVIEMNKKWDAKDLFHPSNREHENIEKGMCEKGNSRRSENINYSAA